MLRNSSTKSVVCSVFTCFSSRVFCIYPLFSAVCTVFACFSSVFVLCLPASLRCLVFFSLSSLFFCVFIKQSSLFVRYLPVVFVFSSSTFLRRLILSALRDIFLSRDFLNRWSNFIFHPTHTDCSCSQIAGQMKLEGFAPLCLDSAKGPCCYFLWFK